MASFSPEAFGKYFLVDKIATGGMAEIFKAKTYSHGGFENLVVIKRILSHLGENEEFVEMFIDEAKLSVALQHPNIIRIYDFGKLQENYFIAMECVEGKDVRNVLRQLSRNGQLLPVQLAAFIAHEAARGLDFAHRKADPTGKPYGIVHRDISPSNLLVSYDGEIKIADFGIAKAESNAYQTRDGVLKGKFEYMSPEQATGKELDRRSDVFSLGIILWEMLTGNRLFKSDNDIRTLEMIRNVEVPPPSQLNPGVPPELDTIVMDALALREQRFQWASELQEALGELLAPQTSDTLRHTLAAFMADTFAEEIAEERDRLAEASQIAARLHAEVGVAAEGAWEGNTAPSLQGPQPPRRAVWPFVLLGAALLAVPVVVGGAAVVGWVATRDPAVLEAPAPTTGGIDVVVLPRSRILLDGALVGESDALVLSDLSPGFHVLRLEADGHIAAEEMVAVVAGESARVVRTLDRIPEEAPPPKKAPEVAPKKEAAVVAPPVERAGPGQLTVALIGGGWANVWVDGQKLPKTAPLSGYEIPSGSHTIRVENAALGIDVTNTVEVTPGQPVTVRASPP